MDPNKQDWTNVSWNKIGAKEKGTTKQQNLANAKRRGHAITTKKKYNAGTNKGKTEQIRDDDEMKKSEGVSYILRQRIQKERLAAGFRTQKEFATRCNVKTEVIAKYENGRAVPSPQFLTKMERVFKQVNPLFIMGTLTKTMKRTQRNKKQ